MGNFEQEVRSARSGDTDAAKKILREIVETVKARKKSDGTPHIFQEGTDVPLPWAIAEYLAECFGQMLESVEPGKALGITPCETGRPEMKASEKKKRDIEYCLAILRSKRTDKGHALPVHWSNVARQFCLNNSSTVRAAWKNTEARKIAEVVERLLERMANSEGPKNVAIK